MAGMGPIIGKGLEAAGAGAKITSTRAASVMPTPAKELGLNKTVLEQAKANLKPAKPKNEQQKQKPTPEKSKQAKKKKTKSKKKAKKILQAMVGEEDDEDENNNPYVKSFKALLSALNKQAAAKQTSDKQESAQTTKKPLFKPERSVMPESKNKRVLENKPNTVKKIDDTLQQWFRQNFALSIAQASKAADYAKTNTPKQDSGLRNIALVAKHGDPSKSMSQLMNNFEANQSKFAAEFKLNPGLAHRAALFSISAPGSKVGNFAAIASTIKQLDSVTPNNSIKAAGGNSKLDSLDNQGIQKEVARTMFAHQAAQAAVNRNIIQQQNTDTDNKPKPSTPRPSVWRS
jgi:hypothetical protein